MEMVKKLLQDKRVLAMVLAALVAGLALLLKVPSQAIKEAYCGKPDEPVVLDAPAMEQKAEEKK